MEVEPYVFHYENGLVVDLKQYPPAPILWVTNALDAILWNAPWRSWLGVSNATLIGDQFKLPHFSATFHPLLSFSDYRTQTAPNASLWEAIVGYASKPSTAIVDPTSLTGILVLVASWIILRSIKNILIPSFSRLGRKVALISHGEEWVKSNEIRVTKFGEYVFRLLFHAAISIYGIIFFLDAPWWNGETKSVYDGCPYHEVPVWMMWYYIIQTAYNLESFLSLIELSLTFHNGMITWSETKRGDFSEMMAHHIATNTLVMMTSVLRMHRIGSMVFFVHDVSDVFVDLSKLANFLKWKITTMACFGVMTCMWVATRLYVLPFVIFKAGIEESHYVMASGASPLLYICYRHILYVFLFMLIALHFFWFLMFLRMLWAMVVKFEVHDYSEHKKGEKQDAVKKKQ